MRERDREIRRRRQRREKAKKARIRALIAQAGKNPKKKPAEALHEVKEEKMIIHKRPAAKVIKPAKEAAEASKKGGE